jgi:hypothetical protein
VGKYQEIANLIEQSVPEYTSLKIVPRGTPIFQDLLMTGTIRFARRTGANFAVLNPDNQFKLSADAQVAQQTLQVDQVLPWLEENALITFNQTEMLEVSTWDVENKQIQILEPLSATRAAGTDVSLWATPLVVHFDSPALGDQLYVRSRYPLVNGDVVTFPVTGALNSLHEVKILKVSFAGIDLDPIYSNIYVLTLEEKLPITLVAGSSPCYLRAYPAYTSQVLNLPNLRSSQLGPFLLDFIASPLDSTPAYAETFAVRTLSSNSQIIDGGANYFKTVEHNYPVVNRPIRAENMIFWRMIRGYGGFVKPNKFRMVATSKLSNGDYASRVSTRLVPAFETGVRYTFTVNASAAGVFVIIPYPYPAVVVNVPVATSTQVSFEAPVNGEHITRLDMIYRSATHDSVVTISDSTLPIHPTVANFQYTYVFHVVGRTNFQATSVIVKPYFLSLSDITARYDDKKTYNSGFVYL